MSKLSRILDETLLKLKFEEKKKEAEEVLKDETKLQKILEKVKEKANKVPVLGPYLEEIPILGNMILDYKNKKYDKLPTSGIVSIIAALLYFLSPLDLIPDFVFSLGLLDDAFVIKLALDGIRYNIHEYQEWKEVQKEDSVENEDKNSEENKIDEDNVAVNYNEVDDIEVDTNEVAGFTESFGEV